MTCPRCDCDDCRRARDPLGFVLARCEALGITPGSDWTVSAADAAQLLGVAVQTLATDRCYFERIPYTRRGGRVRYNVRDIARHSGASPGDAAS